MRANPINQLDGFLALFNSALTNAPPKDSLLPFCRKGT